MAFESVGPFLRRLALIAVGLSAGDAGSVANALGEIPERTLIQALQLEEQLDDDGAERGQRAAVLELLALDARPGVRTAVAEECAAATAPRMSWTRREVLIRRLAGDESAPVRRAAAAALAQGLRGASPWDRVEAVASWAADPDPRVRLALARALPAAPAALGARTALAVLLDDPWPPVRAEAARAVRKI